MAISYKCPSCGGSCEFNPITGFIECTFCGNRLSAEEADNLTPMHDYDNEEDEQQETFDDDNMDVKGYTCPNCGAVVMTDEVTAATFCSYCGNPTLIEGRLTHERKPKLVIPFTRNKQDAKEAFKNWTKKGFLTPSSFRSKATLEKITGIYVPFWLMDCEAQCDMQADGQIIKHYTSRDDEVTEVSHFNVHRNIIVNYDRIPVDASKKMDDSLMDKLEPFDYGSLKPFSMSYLSGYYAEKYTYTDLQLRKRVSKRVENYVKSAAIETIEGYHNVVVKSADVDFRWKNAEYVMLPVWQLNYKYLGKNYTWVMNGQNGRTVGDLPVSIFKAVALFIFSFLILAIPAILIGGLIGGLFV